MNSAEKIRRGLEVDSCDPSMAAQVLSLCRVSPGGAPPRGPTEKLIEPGKGAPYASELR
jgi:hypothetical protein